MNQPASYKLVLLFLVLLYSNLPLLVPALDVLRPAQLLAALALGTLLVERALSRTSLDPVWPDGLLLLAFLGAAALSCLTAIWLRLATEALADLAKMVLIYFLLVNSTNTPHRLRGVMWTMVLAGLIPAVGALRNYATGNLREGRAGWVGIFANPNELAYSLVILLPLTASLASGRRPMVRLALLAIALIQTAAILVTFSRGGLMGLSAVAALYVWRKRSAFLMILMALGMVAALLFASSRWNRAESFSNLEGDAGFRQRLATAQAGLAMFADRPLLGVGVGCSIVAWSLYAPEGVHARHALANHNTFLQVLGETGIVGFVPFMLLLFLGIYHVRKLAVRASRTEVGQLASGLETALWGFVACGMSGGWALSWFAYILLALSASMKRIAERTSL